MATLELVDLNEIKIEDAERLYSLKKDIEKYFKELTNILIAAGESGALIGYELAEKAGARCWIDDEKTIVKTLKKHGVDPYETKLKNFGAIEKLVGSQVMENLLTRQPSTKFLKLKE